MLSISLQRSPRRKDNNLQPQSKAAPRLLRSASVPKLTLQPPAPSPPFPPQNYPRPAFILRSGVKHHAFSPDVPYPLSYYRDVLAWFVLLGVFTPPHLTRSYPSDALDHVTLRSLYKSSSTIDFTERGPPKCCLDLGCGA